MILAWPDTISHPERKMNNAFRRALFCVSILFLIPAISLDAQMPAPEISASVGAMQYDASGTGTAPVVALRGAVPLVGSWLLGEGNFSYASLDEQFSDVGTRVGVAEGQLQFQLPLGRVRPYLGAGAGWLHYFNNAPPRATSPTYSAAAGLRVGLSPRISARAELRLRTWSPFGSGNDSAAEWTGGLAYTF
jgi:Outer membrane protein beta-barrel domain